MHFVNLIVPSISLCLDKIGHRCTFHHTVCRLSNPKLGVMINIVGHSTKKKKSNKILSLLELDGAKPVNSDLLEVLDGLRSKTSFKDILKNEY